MEQRWKGSDGREKGNRPSGSVVVALLLACATLITLDAHGGQDSPIEPARRVAGEAFGPVETFTAGVVRPFAAVPDYFGTRKDLREQVSELEAENAELRRTVETSGLDRNRLAEYDGLTRAAADTGYDLVPAHVIAVGSGQSFSHTVTIDAGTDSGLHADMTVLSNDGLVGRVIRVTRTTATVLLIVDADSVVGGRLASSMEIGFLGGRGIIDSTGRLDLDLMDDSVVANAGDVVTTWGSKDGTPYVAGVPIGRVVSVINSPRETSRRAVIEPFVDFTALDLVGVVVPTGSSSDRDVVRAGQGED
ncbi:MULTISPECIES: rod shape-determining protein MreC [unclassified Nocardioides]|uniref:rod shape-determining protein MreC n=1 Tax=unclassified Nocardioides TaxID=2615069 RepID=UPI0006F79D2B|nr:MULTISPECIES: rod shape-determining protein MreC [unclassified Nocardioides]KQY63675.1 rod shape-determining protein MreC [Nocardioides sp. Root140]KRF15691.1 rod shape-determining protein MreC [Nocardioides sp. Soil796]